MKLKIRENLRKASLDLKFTSSLKNVMVLRIEVPLRRMRSDGWQPSRVVIHFTCSK